jgi:GNAT superfamily N-acetyltransferase
VFAYIADVFVVPEFRGQGIGKALVRAMLDHPDVAGLRVVLLRTRDAHGFYAQFGFGPLSDPDEMMGRYSSLA